MSQATQGMMMADQQKFLSRIGSWFRKNPSGPEERPFGPEEGDSTTLTDETPAGGGGPPESSGGDENNHLEPRNSFLRPWAKRDQAIDNLQRGIGALADLLGSIRENMEKQSQRQEELLSHLAALPEALRAIPEAGRIQGEALRAIHQQIERQSAEQSKLGDVLERISRADNRQADSLDAIQSTVAALNEHDQAIAGNLQSFGSALQSITSNSQSSAKVLEQLHDNNTRRDNELERILRRQNTRFTTLLTVAILMSVAALTAVSVVGYLALSQMK